MSRDGFNPLVITGAEPGGQLMFTTKVENYPGFDQGIKGPELMRSVIRQAQRFGARLVNEEVEGVEFLDGPPFKIKTGQRVYEAQGVIVATGSKPRLLGLESEKRLLGRGVSVCAVCDGAFFKNKKVAVVGGGDSAMEEALVLSRFAAKIYLIHRRDEFRASKVMVDRALSSEKIEVVYNSEVKEVLGDNQVAGVRIFNNKTRVESTLGVSGVFLALGRIPATDIFKGQLEMDEKGYLLVRQGRQSSVPGVFVAGDVGDCRYRQAVVAAGQGCMSALELERFLKES